MNARRSYRSAIIDAWPSRELPGPECVDRPEIHCPASALDGHGHIGAG